jgi:hypothetical protein
MFTAFRILPDRTVFVSTYPHEKKGINLLSDDNFFPAYRQRYGYKPPILIHANHERPWEADNSSRNYMGSVEQITHIYSGFDTVFRHYYYHPLANFSKYLPVGVPVYGWSIKHLGEIITLSSSSFYVFLCVYVSVTRIIPDLGRNAPMKSSKRRNICYFSGVLSYAESHEGEKDREMMNIIGSNIVVRFENRFMLIFI